MSKQPCQIYLTIDVGETALARLGAALDAATIGAVMIAPPPNRVLDAATARPLVELAQSRGVAALIQGDAELARALRADGVHLPASLQIAADYAVARDVLGTRYMVGIDAGTSRHDAMELAEAGADYIAFAADAEADLSFDDDDDNGGNRTDSEIYVDRDLVAWWAGIFQTPCVALNVQSPDKTAALSAVGCEFIGIVLTPGLSPTATAALVRSLTCMATLTPTRAPTLTGAHVQAPTDTTSGAS
jgi:thiamine-phosphate pyrophosphorylase